jgi:pyrimidine-nucleoside phosphorylase
MDDMAMRHCIERKRDGGELSAQDWRSITEAYMDGEVDDAQMAALCMACVWRGMTFDEAHALTDAIVKSGATLSFDGARNVVVDKHSSGGVSDIVSLVAVPLAAACGAHVAKLSGRALGHTGGTIDKLETIPGFKVSLDLHEFVGQVERVGCAIATQTEAIVPADKRIYHLRDRTATVAAMGLIASSIVSKKIAGGAHAFVFDVKTGRGGVHARSRRCARARTLAGKDFAGLRTARYGVRYGHASAAGPIHRYGHRSCGGARILTGTRRRASSRTGAGDRYDAR